ncbi:Css1p SKDI_09G0050 [Saccharomyces kudriavzevii IFO 1802]|uniref:Hyphally-regulated cell wall protein N-terminal domain-containing protein n=1 Tax=Saccharomyces kudriavzevii (strain ATCC MYA-4449 / AS 2.2408 / CBS 8840 / NBRC 1802 / NCYC 2889) TaxID=226230 RepID=A0AA35NRM6_SACK1|nr:uncharacterized protein SKDI_09G0050 [Saccharomyces kudriavzevii IFO 1802]CAI4064285.1 hypothetical protein SKDI_09G0050 [Saccharomyces kudriavzevii IFO 1802]
MFNRFNKFQVALALVLYSQGALGQYYSNTTSIPSNSSSRAVASSSSDSFAISTSITQSASSASDVSSSIAPSTSSATDILSSVSQSAPFASSSFASLSSATATQSITFSSDFSSSIPLSTSSVSGVPSSFTSGSLGSITSSASSASATASNSLSSSDGTIYLPSTTIAGDLTLTGSVIATEAVEIAAGGKLVLLDGDKYVFSADLIVNGDLAVEKSKPTYPGTSFDVSGGNFEVSGNFDAEEPAATSASIYSFTPGSFVSSGVISLNLSEAKKGEVTFSPYSNSGRFSLSNAILNGGSVSGLQRRAETEGSINNGEINLDDGSTYVIVEPISGKGTVNIISGNLYLHYPDTFTGQTVVFKGEGVLAVNPTETNATPIPVVGYTGKNQIAITADITALSYDGTIGVLTATQGNSQFSFAVGTGFSSASFSVSEGTFAGAYAYYLNYAGVLASSATSSSTSTISGASSTSSGNSTSATGTGSITSSGASVSGLNTSSETSISTTGTDSVTSSVSGSSTSSGVSASSFTSGFASVYTTTLTYATATSTIVVSCSETTDGNGNIYTITKTIPCSSTTATITSCDENGCHVTTSIGHDATATVSSKSYTTVTVSHCDDNGCNVRTVTSEAPEAITTTGSSTFYTSSTVTHCDDNGCNVKAVTSEAPVETSTATASSRSFTTTTVTHCDDNGCNLRTVTFEVPEATATITSTQSYTTSEAPKPTSLTAAISEASSVVSEVSKSGIPTSRTIAPKTSNAITIQSEGIAAGLRINALSTLVSIFVLAFFN